ncbi:hypothetical protein DV515_00012131 [Chloebia gouldiae]|uniref:Uncharacterized protein n=1 Tax=Chloebia gouldiae TaxID=44316 RepID=A0A3L8S5A2_CHLGU|nr:hypothetical protein DV515_00012131 [Chloebia gouldiae]
MWCLQQVRIGLCEPCLGSVSSLDGQGQQLCKRSAAELSRGWLFHCLQVLEKWWRGNNWEELEGVGPHT